MLIIPAVALMSEQLYHEYQSWLLHHGISDELIVNEAVHQFLENVEEGRYDIPDGMKADAHRLYLEVRTCRTHFSKGQNPGQTVTTA
jgi:hypothetical protein